MQNIKLGITILTYNRGLDLFSECMESIRKQSDLYSCLQIIDNGNQGIVVDSEWNANVYIPNENLGVAKGWNYGIKSCLENGCDWVLTLNDDIVLRDDQLSIIHKLISSHKDKWMLVGNKSYCTWLLSKAGAEQMEYEKGKWFDEQFYPAYLEDCDFERRIKLIDKSKHIRNLPELDPAIYRKACSSGNEGKKPKYYWDLRRKYVKKWGGGPRHEKFSSPYNKIKSFKRLKEVTDRNQIPELLCDLGLKSFCEIGVRKCSNLKNMLKSNPDKAFGVDIWKEDGIYAHNDSGSKQRTLDKLFSRAKRLEMSTPSLKIIRKYSCDAARDFKDGSLDFVYIDADHTYEGVKADIESWYPKIRSGGIISGHDYENIENQGVSTGVKKAVDDFVSLNKLLFHSSSEEHPSWFAIKN